MGPALAAAVLRSCACSSSEYLPLVPRRPAFSLLSEAPVEAGAAPAANPRRGRKPHGQAPPARGRRDPAAAPDLARLAPPTSTAGAVAAATPGNAPTPPRTDCRTARRSRTRAWPAGCPPWPRCCGASSPAGFGRPAFVPEPAGIPGRLPGDPRRRLHRLPRLGRGGGGRAVPGRGRVRGRGRHRRRAGRRALSQARCAGSFRSSECLPASGPGNAAIAPAPFPPGSAQPAAPELGHHRPAQDRPPHRPLARQRGVGGRRVGRLRAGRPRADDHPADPLLRPGARAARPGLGRQLRRPLPGPGPGRGAPRAHGVAAPRSSRACPRRSKCSRRPAERRPRTAVPALRRAYSAGGPLPRPVFDAFAARFGVRVTQLYGASEIGSVTFNPPDDCPAGGPAARRRHRPVRPRQRRPAHARRLGAHPEHRRSRPSRCRRAKKGRWPSAPGRCSPATSTAPPA